MRRGWRAGDANFRDIGREIWAGRTRTDDAAAVDGQDAENGLNPVELAVVADQGAADLNRAIARGQRNILSDPLRWAV